MSIPGNFIYSIFLFFWSLSVFKTWMFGDMGKLINPRFVPITIASAVIALIMGAAILKYGRHMTLRLSVIKIAILVIPLMVFLGSRPTLFAADSDVKSTSASRAFNPDTDIESEPVLEARGNDPVVISEENYYSVISDMFNFPDLYAGKHIRISGMIVHKNHPKDPSDCAVMRMMMVCCAADLVPVGLTCRFDHASSIPQRSWHHIEGKISAAVRDNDTIPVIMVEKMSDIPEPKDRYIYPL
jgi:putative membrane protein